MLEERARQGEFTTSKERLVSWAGPLTILVGSMWLVGSVGDLAIQSGRLSDETFADLILFLFFLSLIPMLFALIGTRLRFQQSAGVPGRHGLALSVAGCAVMIVNLLAYILLSRLEPEIVEQPGLNYVAMVCLLSIMIGYILFGVDALRYRLLPRWNLLPLLAGSTVVLSVMLDWFGVPSFLPSQLQ